MIDYSLYTRLKVTPLPNKRWRLLEDFFYSADDGSTHTIGAGFITNGADVPRVAWSYQPPNDPDILPAVVVHDYYCQQKQYALADRLFLEIMHKLDISNGKAKMLYRCVNGYTKYIRKGSRK